VSAKNCKLQKTATTVGKPRSRPGARLTDHEVELLRVLHEEHPRGHPKHMGYLALALKFGISKASAQLICRYRRR